MAVMIIIIFFFSCWSWANLIINSSGLIVEAKMTKAYFFATSQLRSLADPMNLLKWTGGCLPWFLLSKIDCLWLLGESICAQLLWKLTLLVLALWDALELTKDPALVVQLGPRVGNPGLSYSGPICLGAGSRCSWVLLVLAVFWLAGDHHAAYVISVKVSKQNTAYTVVLMAGSIRTQIQLNVRTQQLKLLSYRLYVFLIGLMTLLRAEKTALLWKHLESILKPIFLSSSIIIAWGASFVFNKQIILHWGFSP